MEPFFLRCETCHARLRVRDEQFLGQVQSCPKCGSMVQIVAPASLAAAAALPDVTSDAAATPSLLARATSILREHSLVASVGAGTLLIAGGIVGYLALGDGEELTAPPITNVAVVEQPVEDEDVIPVETQPVEASQSTETSVVEPPVARPPANEPKPIEVAAVEEPVPVEQAIAAKPKPPIEQPASPPQPSRTLTLEPVPSEPTIATVAEPAVEAAEYPPTIEVEAVEAEPKPLSPAPAAPPARVTNFADQLSMPIEKIDLPAVPIGEFVNLMSTMTAVPIKLDVKVLGDVGMSSRSTVTVRGENTTAGKLLARVLKERRLTCIKRDGALVVVKAKQ